MYFQINHDSQSQVFVNYISSSWVFEETWCLSTIHIANKIKSHRMMLSWYKLSNVQGQNIRGVWSNVTEEISWYSTKLLWFKVGCIVKVLESNFVSFYFNLIEGFYSENSNTWSDIQTSFKPWVAAIIVSSAHLSDDTLLCQKEKTARSILKPSRQHRSNQ